MKRRALNNLVNEKASISPVMAIRLSKAFGSTAETWLQMQLAFDLAQARRPQAIGGVVSRVLQSSAAATI